MTISVENRIKIAQIAHDLFELFNAFNWETTKEGAEYWLGVYDKLAKLAKEGDSLPDKTKAYVVYEYDRCDKFRTDLKIYKNEPDAKRFCKEHPYVKGIDFYYEEIEAEGFNREVKTE